LGLGQFGIGAVLHRAGGGIAGPERERGGGDGKQARAVHATPPVRGAQAAKQVATQASTKTITDSTRPPGMLAQASRACIRALKKATIQVASSSPRCSTELRVRRDGARPASAQTSAPADTTRPPTISQDAKLLHWTS